MKSYKKELWFNAPERVAFINITNQVEEALRESGIKEGLCLINAMHITASVFINDNERGLHEDYKRWLEELAPHEPISKYLHNRTGEDNGDAHLKRQIMGREVIVAVTDGRLDFGPWEQIFYGEFDGRRRKRVLVKIIGVIKFELTEIQHTESQGFCRYSACCIFFFSTSRYAAPIPLKIKGYRNKIRQRPTPCCILFFIKKGFLNNM